MFKMKIIHKGLFLVGVPLILGIAFVLFLYHGLSESNRIFQHELRLKDAMITANLTTRNSFSAKLCAMSYLFSRDVFFKKLLRYNWKESAQSYKHLEELLQNEPAMHLPSKMSRQEIISNSSYLYRMNRFMQELQIKIDRETDAAKRALNRLQIVLVGGMFVSAVTTIALAVFFCLHITNRLLMIINNTMNLSNGSPLSPPLKGNDEIAELDQLLFKSATEIRDLERFKNHMIGIVSHELKSPLSSVEMFLWSLRSGVFGELSLKSQESVDRTHKSVVNLMNLVRELLYLDRIDLELRPEHLSLSQIISVSIDSVKDASKKADIQIVARNVDGKVYADRNRLLQVIVNLLSNAIKLSPQSGKIIIESRQENGFFECRISQQGSIASKELTPVLLQALNPADSKNRFSPLEQKGTGLGLTITRLIVEQHGGTVGVETTVGNGNIFWFRIPAAEERQAAKAALPPVIAAQAARKKQGAYGQGFKVLQQGLIIISVPLIFQLAFVSVFGYMLNNVKQHFHREEHSKEMLDSLNRMAYQIALASNFGIMYVSNRSKSNLRAWNKSKDDAYRSMRHLAKLSVEEPAQQKNIKEFSESLANMTTVLNNFIHSNKNRHIGNVNFADIRYTGISGISGFSGFSSYESIFKESGAVELIKPLLSGLKAEEKILTQENEISRELSEQRASMIRNAELALFAGIALNVILSTGLAVFLMKNLTGRLKHVSKNMARLVKREALEQPLEGNDEIAYLDQVLFETGTRLEELERFKQELIFVVSNELKTPLMSISMALETFDQRLSNEISDKGQNRLKIAQEEAGRLIRLINDMLDIETMDAGKLVLCLSDIELNGLIRSSLEAVTALADTRKIKLSYSSNKNYNFTADRDRLSQVLINLLTNAIKFSPDKSVIKVAVDCCPSTLRFRITDQGRGIPDEMKEKIFERFVQVDKSDASKLGGSGLGLSICRAIIEQHGGSIGVDSAAGPGSSFWFVLPVKQLAEKHQQLRTAEQYLQKSRLLEEAGLSEQALAVEQKAIWQLSKVPGNRLPGSRFAL